MHTACTAISEGTVARVGAPAAGACPGRGWPFWMRIQECVCISYCDFKCERKLSSYKTPNREGCLQSPNPATFFFYFGENGISVLSRSPFAFLVLWFGSLVEVWSSFQFTSISLKTTTTTTDSHLSIGSTATLAGCFKDLRRTWELLPFISVTVMVPSRWSTQRISSSSQFMAMPETLFSTRHTVCKTKFQYYKYL